MRFFTRITASAAVVGSMALAGCGDLLDVENPNNVTEEAAQRLQGASALVNGAEARVYAAISGQWLPYLTASDDLFWDSEGGSRDAWGSLDQGLIADPLNEFIDQFYSPLAQARWLAKEAVDVMQGHVDENQGDSDLVELLARANLNAGIIYMIVGETMQEFAISDKDVEGEIYGADQMDSGIFQPAIEYLNQAIIRAEEVGDAPLVQAATAVRARAHHSRAVRQKIQPSIAADPYVNDTNASADAAAVLATADADWQFRLSYSAATVDNEMAGWVNSRGEPQVSTTLRDLTDLIDTDWAAAAPVVDVFAQASENYTDLILTSTRMMHLILAEAALAGAPEAEVGSFTENINNLRALDGLEPFSGQVDAEELFRVSRQANTALQGLRLADMYRFGVVDPIWLQSNTTIQSPGTLTPIGCVEIRANSQLDDSPC